MKFSWVSAQACVWILACGFSFGFGWSPGIFAYHFHVYFDHTDLSSVSEAISLRKRLTEIIEDGTLSNCRLNLVSFAPRGPHPLGNFETCCNSSSFSDSMSFFMENRGNLSILVHPLTRWELLDHSNRAMYLGQFIQLNLSFLSQDLGDDVDNCSLDETDIVDPNLLII